MQNSQLSGQIDKLKRLCHLCLNLIMTPEQQQKQSSSSTSPAIKSDRKLENTANEPQSLSPDSPTEDQIELLILEYLYSGNKNCKDPERANQLVKHFEELAFRLSAATNGEMANLNKSTQLQTQLCEQKKRKRSLIKRIISGFHHHNELESLQKTSQTLTVPSSPMCTHLANSAATAASHHSHNNQQHIHSIRPSNSIQKLHEFFEFQQENQRILPKACSAQEAADDAENEDANQLTVTNNYHLQIAQIKAMNGGIGSPTKSVSATEEHSGAQLSTHIHVNDDIVDTTPKMSEVAMFCGKFFKISSVLSNFFNYHPGLRENNVANPLLNVAKRREAEKRHQQEEENKFKKKDKKEEEENKAKGDKGSVLDSNFFVSLYTLQQQQQQLQASRPLFNIGSSDEDDEEYDVSSRDTSPPDSVVDETSEDGECSSLDEMDMEQEMDRLLEHIHQHRWFVLPPEAASASDIVVQLNTEVTDLNNVEAAFQTIHRLWLARKHSTSRLLFFYQMFTYLFDKYLNVIYCDCHHPPCLPSVEASIFGKLAVQIVRRLLECINRSRHLVIQIELLSSIESLVYNRPHYRPALSEVFHHLFTAGLVEATAFVEWAKLDDPSAQFEAAQPKQSNNGPSLPLKTQLQKTTSKESNKTKLKASLSMSPKLTTTTSLVSSSSSAQQKETPALTNRERLFQELKKAGFAIFKCKF